MLLHSNPAGRATRWRELALLGASLAFCLLVLGGLEALARRGAAPAQGEAESHDLYEGHEYSETLGWAPRAGARFRVLDAPTSINAAGYRGRQAAVRPGPGRRRVLHLGDSVAFGYGVADEQTFAHLIDPAGERYESLNLAVPGYGVDQSLLRFEEQGRREAADVVVLSLCVDNDLADVMLPVFLYDGRHPKPWFRLGPEGLELHREHLRLAPTARAALWLRRHSALARRLGRSAAAPAAEEQPAEHWAERRRQAIEDHRAALDLMAALLARLRRDVEGTGAELIVAVHPNKPAFQRPARWVKALARRAELRGLVFVDVAGAYRAEGLGFGAVTLDGVGHLNATGHRLAARALREALDREAGS